jgi:hypothetical protein
MEVYPYICRQARPTVNPFAFLPFNGAKALESPAFRICSSLNFSTDLVTRNSLGRAFVSVNRKESVTLLRDVWLAFLRLCMSLTGRGILHAGQMSF